MSGEKVEEQNLISEVGMKSRLEDLGWVKWRSFDTSVDVTVVMTENLSPEWVGSGHGGGKLNWEILDLAVRVGSKKGADGWRRLNQFIKGICSYLFE